jgi:polysaccharide biosynthesis PFTS motif protein
MVSNQNLTDFESLGGYGHLGYDVAVISIFNAFKNSLITLRNFLFLTVLLLFAMTVKFISKQISYPSLIFYSLSFEQAYLHSNPRELKLFLKEKRFTPYLSTENVLWQVRSWSPRRVISRGFTYDASFYLFVRCVSWNSIFLVIKKLVNFKYLSKTLHHRYLKEVYTKVFEDFVWTITCGELESKIQLVTTQSQFMGLPINFSNKYAQRTFRIMMWYSINSQGISRDFASPEGISLDKVRGKIDQQLVWTESHRALLHNKGVGQVHVVGSCLFQTNHEFFSPRERTGELSVLFFDVAPIRDDISDKIRRELNLQDSLYNHDFCSMILIKSISILDSFAQSRGISLKVILKPKRIKHRSALNYNARYENLLRNLSIREPRFSVAPPHLNVYTMIKNADLVLGPPYTSPIFVASELSVPSCYLAFQANDWRIYKSLDSIPVHFSEEEFQEFLEQSFPLN